MNLKKIISAFALVFAMATVPAFALNTSHPVNANANNNTNFEQRFTQMDRNGDGYIEFSEWTGDRTSFDRIDVDRNGMVTHGEMQQAVASRGNGNRHGNRNGECRKPGVDGVSWRGSHGRLCQGEI